LNFYDGQTGIITAFSRILALRLNFYDHEGSMGNGEVLKFCKLNLLAILVQTFFVLAFISGYITYLSTFLSNDRSQVRCL